MYFLLLATIMIILWLAFPRLLPFMMNSTPETAENLQLRGVYGDSYGVFNSLVSALALCGVALTLHLQNQQMQILKTQERENEEAQRIQTRLMAATAAINYYNSEADRQQEIMFELRQSQDEKAEQMKKIWMITYVNLTKKRDYLIAEIESLMKQTSPNPSAPTAPASSSSDTPLEPTSTVEATSP
jgi:uncharacterized protein HemX